MKHYIKYRFWDWILCVVISLGLVFHIYSGFVLTDSVSSSLPLVIIFLCVIQMLLFLFAYTKRAMIAGIALGIGLAVVFLVYVRENNVISDESAYSLSITITITIITALMVFLACRTRPGIITLFLIGNLVIAGSYFLEFPIETWEFIVFLIGVFIMFWYRNYCISFKVISAGKIHIKQYMAQIVTICIACILIATALFIGIIGTLNPPTQELKLIQKMESMDMLQVLGVSSVREVINSEITSSQEAVSNDTSDETDENETDDSEDETEDTNDDSQTEDQENDQTDTNIQEDTQAVYYDLDNNDYILIIILSAVIISSPFIIRMILKRRWEKKVNALEREDAVVNYYQFFFKRLSRNGYKKPVNHTLHEYAYNIEHQMQAFDSDEAKFSDLTDVYSKVIYGRYTVSEEEYNWFEKFYHSFYKNLRHEKGMIYYFIRIFLI